MTQESDSAYLELEVNLEASVVEQQCASMLQLACRVKMA